MRKMILIVLSSVILVALAVTAIFLFGTKSEKEADIGTMVVNNEAISDTEIFFCDGYVAVPFVKLLRMLGYNAERADGNVTKISGVNGDYLLDIGNASFVKDGENFNMIGEAPLFCKKYDEEIFLDDTALMSIFGFMNYQNAYFSEDHDALTVYISVY